jgi:Fe-S-cluster-containing hydrogenase component 2
MRYSFPAPHSVALDPASCAGCATCAAQCPSDAIRVREGRSSIRPELCIDCGSCIRACPRGARRAISDPLSAIEGFGLKVALPAPTLYGQFGEGIGADRVNAGLLELGFDEVFELGEAAEMVAEAAEELMSRSSLRGPWISSACPAVVKLVALRFPGLLPRLVPLIPPMEAAARMVKDGSRAGVGVFFITPCAGKVAVTRAPLGYPRSAIDGVISLRDIHGPLRSAIAAAPGRGLAREGRGMPGPARVLGGPEAVGGRRSISVDGLAGVVAALEAVMAGGMEDVAYIEALACPSGCLGGPLTAEDPRMAAARLRGREDRPAEAQARARRPPPREGLGWSEAIGLESDRSELICAAGLRSPSLEAS